MKIKDLQCQTLDIDYIDLSWEVSSSADPQDYTFRVYRSEAEFGPYTPVSKEFTDKYTYRDSTAAFRNPLRHFYYRLLVTNKVTSESFFYPEETVPGATVWSKPNLVALEHARTINLKLKEFEGRIVWVYPIRTFGTRCTRCFDASTQQRLKSNCLSCFGTSFLGGYHNPIACHMSIADPQQTVQVSDMAKMTPIRGTGRLGNYPSINENDIVIETENIRWRIFGVQNTTMQRSVIRQTFGLERIPPSDIAYRLPIRTDLFTLEATAARQFTNPQSLAEDRYS